MNLVYRSQLIRLDPPPFKKVHKINDRKGLKKKAGILIREYSST